MACVRSVSPKAIGPRYIIYITLVVALTLVGTERTAWAQACCSGTNTVSPGRLALGEDVLVGFSAKASWDFGSFDASGHYHASPPGNAEVDLEQDLVLALRLTDRAQLAFLWPFLQTWRKVPGLSQIGGGFGDVNIAGRYDFTLAGDSGSFPGIALLAGLTVPTGTPPDRAKQTLTTDATGIGAVQASLGLAIEQLFERHYLINLSGILTQRLPRNTQHIQEQLGLTGAASLSAGYIFDRNHGIALVAHYEQEADASINGQTSPNTQRKLTSLAASAGFSLFDQWRMQTSVTWLPPIQQIGQNQLASLGTTATLICTW